MPLGIAFDIGAYECKAAILRGEGYDAARLEQETSILSVAYVDKNGEILVGQKAQPYVSSGSNRVVVDVKRRIIKGEKELPDIPGVSYIDIYMALIKEVIDTHSKRLKENADGEIESIVLTVPSFLEEREDIIAEMKRAAESIDIGNGKTLSVDLLVEPAGVGIHNLDYLNRKESDGSEHKKRTQIIYDLGHSTLDVALITSHNEGELSYELHSFRADDETFCEYFDMRIVEEMKRVLAENGFEVENLSRKEKAMLRKRAREIKHALSDDDECTETLELETDDVEFTLTRKRFEELIEVCLRNSAELVREALETAEDKGITVDEIVLAGGGSKIPLVEKLIKEVAGDVSVRCSFRPVDAVSFGAARYALSRNLTQKAKFAYGIELPGELGSLERRICPMIPADAKLPYASQKLSEVKLACNPDGVFRTALYSYSSNAEKGLVEADKCRQIRCITFEVSPNKPIDLFLEIDEEHCVKVLCETAEGEKYVMTSFDAANARARREN